MNYKKIHDNLLIYIRSTPIKQRLMKRNCNDSRLNLESIYVEVHHIIPRSLGGLDNKENLIQVLPEEHLFFHMLRYKIFRKIEDMWAVRIMLNGCANPNKYKLIEKNHLTKKIRMGYAWVRTHAYFVRKTTGWHSKEGLQRISDSRKGKMIVKDAVTNEIIGSIEKNHPNVLSGLWVHHSKGRIPSQQERERVRLRNIGQSNPNASGLSDEYFIQKGVEAFCKFGYILSWPEMHRLSIEQNFPWIKSLRSRFNGTGVNGYYLEMEKQTRIKFDPYYTRKQKNHVKN